MSAKKTPPKLHRALTVVGIIMCVILVPILVINCTLLVKSFINKEAVPDFGGMLPMIVLTDSMYPDIESGYLIICKTIDAEDVEVGDVISFYDPEGNGTAVVTHKVIEIIDENGSLSFKTMGINNNTEDRLPVPAKDVIAEYTGVRVPGAGNFALFMQSSTGLIVCVILPIIVLVGYDLIRRKIYEKSTDNDMAALMAELEALKAEKAKTDENAGEESDKDEAPKE